MKATDSDSGVKEASAATGVKGQMGLCGCGHKRKAHTKYQGNGTNRKGSRFVCTEDNCHSWNQCDLEVPSVHNANDSSSASSSPKSAAVTATKGTN